MDWKPSRECDGNVPAMDAVNDGNSSEGKQQPSQLLKPLWSSLFREAAELPRFGADCARLPVLGSPSPTVKNEAALLKPPTGPANRKEDGGPGGGDAAKFAKAEVLGAGAPKPAQPLKLFPIFLQGAKLPQQSAGRPSVASRLPVQKVAGKADGGGNGGNSRHTSTAQCRTLPGAGFIRAQMAADAVAEVKAETGGPAQEQRQAVQGCEGDELLGPGDLEGGSGHEARDKEEEDETSDDDIVEEHESSETDGGDDDSDSDWAPSAGAGGGRGRSNGLRKLPAAGAKGGNAGTYVRLEAEGVNEYDDDGSDEDEDWGPARGQETGDGARGRRMSGKLRLSGGRGDAGNVAAVLSSSGGRRDGCDGRNAEGGGGNVHGRGRGHGDGSDAKAVQLSIGPKRATAEGLLKSSDDGGGTSDGGGAYGGGTGDVVGGLEAEVKAPASKRRTAAAAGGGEILEPPLAATGHVPLVLPPPATLQRLSAQTMIVQLPDCLDLEGDMGVIGRICPLPGALPGLQRTAAAPDGGSDNGVTAAGDAEGGGDDDGSDLLEGLTESARGDVTTVRAPGRGRSETEGRSGGGGRGRAADPGGSYGSETAANEESLMALLASGGLGLDLKGELLRLRHAPLPATAMVVQIDAAAATGAAVNGGGSGKPRSATVERIFTSCLFASQYSNGGAGAGPGDLPYGGDADWDDPYGAVGNEDGVVFHDGEAGGGAAGGEKNHGGAKGSGKAGRKARGRSSRERGTGRNQRGGSDGDGGAAARESGAKRAGGRKGATMGSGRTKAARGGSGSGKRRKK